MSLIALSRGRAELARVQISPYPRFRLLSHAPPNLIPTTFASTFDTDNAYHTQVRRHSRSSFLALSHVVRSLSSPASLDFVFSPEMEREDPDDERTPLLDNEPNHTRLLAWRDVEADRVSKSHISVSEIALADSGVGERLAYNGMYMCLVRREGART